LFESACRSTLCSEHDLFRKPASSPHQVRAKLFRDHALDVRADLGWGLVLGRLAALAALRRNRGSMSRAFSLELPKELKEHSHPALATLGFDASPMHDLADVAAEATVRGHAEPMAALGTGLHDTRLAASSAAISARASLSRRSQSMGWGVPYSRAHASEQNSPWHSTLHSRHRPMVTAPEGRTTSKSRARCRRADVLAPCFGR
jgi:hypothetical protein